MKKGFAVEGFIREDGTVQPLVGYDDTELREKIQKNTDDIDNLDSRVDAIEGSLGLDPISFGINRETLAVRDEDKPALVEFVKDYIHKGGIVCNVYFYTLGQNDGIGGYTYSCTAHISTPTPIHTSGSIYIAVGNIYYALSFSYDTSTGEVTLGTTWTRGVKEVDDVPTEGSEKLLTSGVIKAALDGKNFLNYTGGDGEASVTLDDDAELGGEITISVKKGSASEKKATIYSDNIDNFNRALKTPSSSPENSADKLITSKAVYDALAKTVPYYNGTVLIKRVNDTIAYPLAGNDNVKNALLTLYNSIQNNKYVLCRVTLDNSAITTGDIVTVPAFAYAEEGDLQGDWKVDILLANGVKFTADVQSDIIPQSWTKATTGFFS